MNIDLKQYARRTVLNILLISVTALGLMLPQTSMAARVKDIANVKGVRENILIGYGVVIGLKGTGDSSADMTGQSLGRLFGKLGLDVQGNTNIKSKNAAAVIVTAKLPPFARVGNLLDVTVSSIGDSASLEGGMLIVTPLRAGDQNVYAVAQGPISIGAIADGSTKNFPTVGRIVNGATIEKDIDSNFSAKKNFRLALHNPDFTTSARMAALINSELGGKFASSRDSGTIDVVVPFNYEGNSVELLARIENIGVNVDTRAKIVLNERTGTVVMGERVMISPVAISHGELSIEVKGGEGKAAGKAEKSERLAEIRGTSVSELVKALNTLGVQPKDLTAIFQTLKQVGALQADLEIM
ncbi:MAG: flagellar biosynthesis protein FlgA [Bdellovibrionales bacterium GWB1_52_6]|nr:MAG: flagellar biosynthesis protein FlgA [Bdellovibrionales bacterium GWB1_52_6]OFZ04387.1 MAG: flagellar biosynthesis protein FlgA [Bdellovibrionales bacterium GWA1_52_35]HCM40757.1 flagellar biosynthesis protein FlgA [Bdellovibrionales bacterium]